jgi:hypothetical protein
MCTPHAENDAQKTKKAKLEFCIGKASNALERKKNQTIMNVPYGAVAINAQQNDHGSNPLLGCFRKARTV